MKSLALLALLAPALAGAQTYGDWNVDALSDENAVYAATLNPSGGLLGKRCAPDGCSWIVTLKVGCTSNGVYPALLSSGPGSFHVTLICTPNDKSPGRYTVREFDVIDKAVQSSDAVGIAMALESGEFRVGRYATRGWSGAAEQLRQRAATMLRQPGERSL